MQDAQERMQAAGCDIAMLGGQRQRYERFGYVPAGAHWEFTLTPVSYTHLAADARAADGHR